MYALAQVEKFLADNKATIPHQKARRILTRAKEEGARCKPYGILVSGGAPKIWRDQKLQDAFFRTIMSNVEMMDIGTIAARDSHT